MVYARGRARARLREAGDHAAQSPLPKTTNPGIGPTGAIPLHRDLLVESSRSLPCRRDRSTIAVKLPRTTANYAASSLVHCLRDLVATEKTLRPAFPLVSPVPIVGTGHRQTSCRDERRR